MVRIGLTVFVAALLALSLLGVAPVVEASASCSGRERMSVACSGRAPVRSAAKAAVNRSREAVSVLVRRKSNCSGG